MGAGPSPERAPAQTPPLNMAALPAPGQIRRHKIATHKSASVRIVDSVPRFPVCVNNYEVQLISS